MVRTGGRRVLWNAVMWMACPVETWTHSNYGCLHWTYKKITSHEDCFLCDYTDEMRRLSIKNKTRLTYEWNLPRSRKGNENPILIKFSWYRLIKNSTGQAQNRKWNSSEDINESKKRLVPKKKNTSSLSSSGHLLPQVDLPLFRLVSNIFLAASQKATGASSEETQQ